jgi:drug/metabolite transporter (DMT)-like permease
VVWAVNFIAAKVGLPTGAGAGILLLGERGSLMQIIGCTLALGGVYWVESGRESPIHN